MIQYLEVVWLVDCQQKTDKHLPIMAELLGVDEDQMRYWLCHRKIVTANEVLTKPLTAAQVKIVDYFLVVMLLANDVVCVIMQFIGFLNVRLLQSSKIIITVVH